MLYSAPGQNGPIPARPQSFIGWPWPYKTVVPSAQCGSTQHKKNGHIHNGKQNHRCKACGRQFVREFEQRRIPGEHRALIERLLKERLSLRGICRAVGVGMKWLMGFPSRVLWGGTRASERADPAAL
jgi:hypothetical protein